MPVRYEAEVAQSQNAVVREDWKVMTLIRWEQGSLAGKTGSMDAWILGSYEAMKPRC